MKKILLVGAVIISAVSFANTHAGHNMGAMNSDKPAMDSMNCKGVMGGHMQSMDMMKDGKCSMMEGKGHMGSMMSDMKPEQKMAMEKEMIAIQEKQLEVRKLMNTANPDMKKVEKLNGEIAQMRTKHMESMQKMMSVPAKTN